MTLSIPAANSFLKINFGSPGAVKNKYEKIFNYSFYYNCFVYNWLWYTRPSWSYWYSWSLIHEPLKLKESTMIQKIISGAQTGADRAGIDAAIESGIEYGGWVPEGRKAEDGIVPEKYNKLQEMTRGGYPERTEQNVIDSDGTVIFGYGKLTTGSALTLKLAEQHEKPFRHIDLDWAIVI